MLPRAALRAIKPSSICNYSSPHLLRYGVSIAAPAASQPLRKYASSSARPPRQPPQPSSPRPPKPPPPPKPFPASSGPARQTSPGTAVPKDQTWKPKDAISFGDPTPATSTAAGAAAAVAPTPGAQNVRSPVEGARMKDGAKEGESPPHGEKPISQEQLAQQLEADQPAPGTAQEVAQEKFAQSEQQQPPQPPPDAASQASGPLPDLRQGIPSTFDLEFGAGKPGARTERAFDEQAESQEHKLDLTSLPAESQQRREREEREYDRSAYETSLDRRRAQLANYLYASILLGALTGCFYLARPFGVTEDVPRGLEPEEASGWSPGKMYNRVRARLGNQMGYYTEPSFPQLLPDVPESQRPPFTLVLSLEDLLIHTTWDTKYGYRTAKRPGVDYFIRYLSQYYELVLFTSVPRAIADPVVAKLDPFHFIMWPLGREATKYDKGEYVKDLSYLNRPLNKTLIVDTHAPHVKNQPENAIILPKWSGDPKDPHTNDLVALIPFLEYAATMGIEDVRTVIKSFEGKSIPEEFARRENEARKRFNAQLAEERRRKPKFSLGSIAGSLGVKGGGSMGGGMVLADGQSVAEGLAQGKMLSDQIREQGQKQYEHLEKQIRENGEQWLKEEAEELKRLSEAQMKDMKQGALSWFTGGSGKKE